MINLKKICEAMMDRGIIAPLSLAFLCLVGYWPVLGNPFLLDDYFVIFNQSGVGNKSFLEVFTTYQHLFYRPVGHFPLWSAYQLFGTHPFPYRLVGLCLFWVICILIYLISRKILNHRFWAWLVAALFCVHPFNNMLINNISAYVLLTYVLMLCVSYYCAINYWENKNKLFYVVSILAFILSLFSHETSILFPAYVFCFTYFLGGRGIRKSLVFCAPYIFIVLGYLFFRTEYFSLKHSASVVGVVMLQVFPAYLSSVMALIYWYIKSFLFPLNYVFLWTIPMEESYNSFEWIRVLLILGVLIYLIFARWKKNITSFAMCIFTIGLIPAGWASFAHFPSAEPMIEPHWFYFSSIGAFILIAQGLIWIKNKFNERLGLSLTLVVLSVFFVLLQMNNQQWGNQEKYCQFWIKHNPYNATPYYGLSQLDLQNGYAKTAIYNFQTAIKFSPRYQAAFVTADLAYAFILDGQNALAEKFLKISEFNDPEYALTQYYFGLLFMNQGDMDKAERSLLKAVALYPRSQYLRGELKRFQERKSLLKKYPIFEIE